MRAGLAITVLTPSMLGPDMRVLGTDDGLPALPSIEIALHRSTKAANKATEQLALQLHSHIEGYSPENSRSRPNPKVKNTQG